MKLAQVAVAKGQTRQWIKDQGADRTFEVLRVYREQYKELCDVKYSDGTRLTHSLSLVVCQTVKTIFDDEDE